MAEISPWGEVCQTNEELAAEIREELRRLEEKKTYLWELLASVDPAAKAALEARESFIDRFYEGE